MLMNRLVAGLLFAVCFTLATSIERWRTGGGRAEERTESLVALVFGEGRAIIANSLMAKADAYFHRGNYPSIFEAQRTEENHMTGATRNDGGTGEDEHSEHSDHAGHDHEREEGGVGDHRQAETIETADWIERFGKKFRAADHVHLNAGEEREMLPWLKLSAELDRNNIDAFTVGAYWLRKRVGKPGEAEQFLRTGLRSNPGNPELLNELAYLNFESRKDFSKARNLWLAALRQWNELEQPKEKPDKLLAGRILGGLAELETAEKRWGDALNHLEQLKAFSPNPDAVQKRIDELRTKMPGSVQH